MSLKEFVNRELLIKLVNERPNLWDRNVLEYRDKIERQRSWREIYVLLKQDMGEDYDELSPLERKEFGKLVIRSWNFTRDSWVRSLQRMRPYKYHQQMLFLKRVINTTKRNTAEREDDTDNEETVVPKRKRTLFSKRQNNTEDFSENKRRYTSIKIESEAIEPEPEVYCQEITDEEMEQTNETQTRDIDVDVQIKQAIDRHLCFFKSVLPTLALFDDDQILEFQSGVISLLQNIKRRRDPSDPLQTSSRNYFENRSRQLRSQDDDDDVSDD